MIKFGGTIIYSTYYNLIHIIVHMVCDTFVLVHYDINK